jgi:hypothetical protein
MLPNCLWPKLEFTYSQDYKGVADLRRFQQNRESKMARKNMRKVKGEYKKVRTVKAMGQQVQIKDKEGQAKG